MFLCFFLKNFSLRHFLATRYILKKALFLFIKGRKGNYDQTIAKINFLPISHFLLLNG